MGIASSEHKNVLNLLKEIRMLRCKLANILIEYTTKQGIIKECTQWIKGDTKDFRKLIYPSHIGPNIAFSIIMVS